MAQKRSYFLTVVAGFGGGTKMGSFLTHLGVKFDRGAGVQGLWNMGF